MLLVVTVAVAVTGRLVGVSYPFKPFRYGHSCPPNYMAMRRKLRHQEVK